MNKNDRIAAILMWIFMWVSLSMVGSCAKADQKNCGKNYYVDYIIITNLFCEIRE